MKMFAIVVLLCSVCSSASCAGGSCALGLDEREETSLMQVTKTLSHGKVRGLQPATVPPLNTTVTAAQLQAAKNNMKDLKVGLDNVTKLGVELAKNLSKAVSDIGKYNSMRKHDREYAVNYGHSEGLANQSIRFAEKALADAVKGEAAAQLSAAANYNKAHNATLDKFKYRKDLIDAEDAQKAALDALHVGQVAMHRANLNLDQATRQAIQDNNLKTWRTNINSTAAYENQGRADLTEAKGDMEVAFVNSSLNRTKNNTPSFGEYGGDSFGEPVGPGWGK